MLVHEDSQSQVLKEENMREEREREREKRIYISIETRTLLSAAKLKWLTSEDDCILW